MRSALGLLARLALRGEKLAINLNDHLAGSTAALELARRAAASNRDNEYARTCGSCSEVERDRAMLERLRRRAVREALS